MTPMNSPLASTVAHYRTRAKLDIYSISIRVFDNFRANIYVIDHPDALILVDTGSGVDYSNRGISRGLTEIGQALNRRFELKDFDLVFITHGHIDHFGGLGFVLEESSAEAWVHPDDQTILANFSERVEQAVICLSRFLKSSGVPQRERARLLDVYRWGKGHYRSQPVSANLKEGMLAAWDFEVIHVPGHCPGQICLRIDEVLLTGDHVLSRISPHLAPQSITLGTGLKTYLSSLKRIQDLEGIHLSLGGHEEPMLDLPARCAAIRALHQERLLQVEQLCRSPLSIRELTLHLFGQLRSYHTLLGLEEAGALAEFLVDEGRLSIETDSRGTIFHCVP